MSEQVKAGRELDRLVASNVMGLVVDERLGHWESAPYYSTDIAAAWQVVEKLTKDGFQVLTFTRQDDDDEQRLVHNCTVYAFVGIAPDEEGEPLFEEVTEESCDTMPFAICLAALAAVGGGEE